MNVLVMYDRQTESYWSQLLGEAVEGELKGTKLTYLPSWQTTWLDWKTKHPDTLALKKNFSGSEDIYDGYYQSDASGVIGRIEQDNRLYAKEFVIGVAIDNDAITYPFSVLNETPVLNDSLGNTPLLVFFDPGPASGIVYSRRVDARILSFTAIGEGQLQDDQTNSVWDAHTGVSIDGELQGARLERISSTQSFWFGWKDFYPNTVIFGIDEYSLPSP